MSSLTAIQVFEAMLNHRDVLVETTTRSFVGRLREIGLSPYESTVRASVVDREGRVHYFHVDRANIRHANG